MKRQFSEDAKVRVYRHTITGQYDWCPVWHNIFLPNWEFVGKMTLAKYANLTHKA